MITFLFCFSFLFVIGSVFFSSCGLLVWSSANWRKTFIYQAEKGKCLFDNHCALVQISVKCPRPLPVFHLQLVVSAHVFQNNVRSCSRVVTNGQTIEDAKQIVNGSVQSDVPQLLLTKIEVENTAIDSRIAGTEGDCTGNLFRQQ